MSGDDRVAAAAEIVSGHMEKIMECFKPGGKITVLVRQPESPDQDFLMTNDDLSEAIAALQRRKEAGPTG